ncbi:unnamed protein product [Mytilus edulis]|uniref:Uncharacterized protein n=1 Tax=Mytilus edulis TaxID=6550 RepID=A0A8S3VK65_MYTED|nr:unnamed protein product [Mytilus edulis]
MQTGLNVNAKKTKVMSINTRNTTPITINDLPVDSVDDFTYLGSIISKDNGTGKDIKARLSKETDLLEMSKPVHFKLTIEIGCQQQVDVDGMVKVVNGLLGSKAMFKFRVVGEPKILAFFEVQNPAEVSTMCSSIMREGNFKVTCTSLLTIEEWAQIIGVDSKLTGPPPRKLTKEVVYMIDVNAECNGMTTDEFLNIWKEEATAALSVRAAGVDLELFKVFGQRKVIVLICQDSPGDWEKLMLNLPFVKKMYDRCHFELTTLTKL